MYAVTAEEAAALRTKGAFTVGVIPSSVYFASRANQSLSLPCHEAVLRPLLQCAVQAYVFELKEASEVFEAGRSFLTRKAGNYEISLTEEPIKGHELFWNAAGGKRGSIVLLFNPADLPAARVFPHCECAYIVDNPSVPHSPAAMRNVKAATSDGGLIAGVFSRTNGIQWLSFHAHPDLLIPLFAQAKELTRGAEAPAS